MIGGFCWPVAALGVCCWVMYAAAVQLLDKAQHQGIAGRLVNTCNRSGFRYAVVCYYGLVASAPDLMHAPWCDCLMPFWVGGIHKPSSRYGAPSSPSRFGDKPVRQRQWRRHLLEAVYSLLMYRKQHWQHLHSPHSVVTARLVCSRCAANTPQHMLFCCCCCCCCHFVLAAPCITLLGVAMHTLFANVWLPQPSVTGCLCKAALITMTGAYDSSSHMCTYLLHALLGLVLCFAGLHLQCGIQQLHAIDGSLSECMCRQRGCNQPVQLSHAKQNDGMPVSL